MKSLRCFQLTSLFALLLALIAATAGGCSDTPDRSLFINAYTAVNQGKAGAIQALELVDNYQVGIFQKLGEGYVPVFGPVQLTDDNLSLGKNAVSYSEGELVFLIEGYAQSGLTSGQTVMGFSCDVAPVLQPTQDDDGRARVTFNPGTCAQNPSCQAGSSTETEDTEKVAEVKDVLVRGVSAPFRFNGDDAVSVDVMMARTNWFAEIPSKEDPEKAMELENPRHGHGVVQIPGGKLLVIGGVFGRVSAGLGQFKVVPQVERVDIFARTKETLETQLPRAFFTLTRYEEDFTLEIDQGTGLNIPPEKVRFLVVGGLAQVAASGMDPMVGATYSNEVTLVTYDVVADSLSVEAIGSLAEGVVMHQASYLGEGFVLITGGRNQAGAPTSAAYLVSMEDGTVANMAPMNLPRYGHSATAVGDTVVVFGGYGSQVEDGHNLTLSSLEVWAPGAERNLAAGTFKLGWDSTRVCIENGNGGCDEQTLDAESKVMVEGDETLFSGFHQDMSRAEHVAVPLVDRDNSDNNRVVILGGIRKDLTQDELAVSVNDESMPAIFIDPNGAVTMGDENPSIGYIVTRQRETKGPYYKSAWAKLAGNSDAIFVTGGQGDAGGGKLSEDSITTAKLIRFGVNAFGKISISATEQVQTPMEPNPLFFDSVETTYRMNICDPKGNPFTGKEHFELKMVDPEDEKAKVGRPTGIDESSFKLGMARFRRDHTLTVLEDGTYLVVGGFSQSSGQGQSIGTFELFMPPSVNTPGGGFQMIPEL